MPRPTKRSVLSSLDKARLAGLVEHFEVDISRRSARAKLVDALARSRRAPFADILDQLSLNELKQICRDHELDDGGRAKRQVAERILDPRAQAEPPAKTALPKKSKPKSKSKPKRQLSLPDVSKSPHKPPVPAAKDTPPKSPKADAKPDELRTFESFSEIASFIWSIADLLRGDFKAHEYGQVILPFTVLRRLDQVLEPTATAVRAAAKKYEGKPPAVLERHLQRAAAGADFYNASAFGFKELKGIEGTAANFTAYIDGFSANVREILDSFRFRDIIARLEQNDLLLLVTQKFAKIDLHPERVSNAAMGSVFEELIRKFSEQSNETAGEHFTPREVIRLMVELLFVEDEELLGTPGVSRTLYDPACGTGGMLSVAEEHLHSRNPQADLVAYGQELNPESYAVCRADMLLKGQGAERIKLGNSFSDDGHGALTVDYLLSNPPFGVDWTKAEKTVRKERADLGDKGRFGPGLPRKNDGSLLFLLHMLSKMKPVDQGGSRLAIVFNGSPLFTGAAESGESEIRGHVLENDLLEAIVALPDQMFFNTGINTYVWVLTNRKPKARRGKVQLINAVSMFQKMRKSLGDKRKELSDEHISSIVEQFKGFAEGPTSKIFANEDFGFRRITVERPLQLDFEASEERIARLAEERAWKSLSEATKTSGKGKGKARSEAEIAEGRALQEAVLGVLKALPKRRFLERPGFLKAYKAELKRQGVSVPAGLNKAVLAALSERNPEAELCRDKKGKVEADSELRDYENVPLTEDVDAYMAREVLPHVPDAWVDGAKMKVGYEIPFTRHFYEYVPPRELSVIEGEIRALEAEIQGMLEEVLGR